MADRKDGVATAPAFHRFLFEANPQPMWVFDRETMGVLFAFFLGVELAFWSIAVAQLTGYAGKGNWRRALNAPIIAISTAIALNALGAKAWMPSCPSA